jgi:hypothetical protein
LLDSPTGILSTDLSTARSILVSSISSSLESDIRNVNLLIDSVSTGSTQDKIGTPVINSAPSNLSSIIGGSGSDIASLLGDPTLGDSGISSLINAPSVVNTNSVFNELTGFQNATSINSQLNAFLALFNPSNLVSNVITFNITGQPTSLADLISMASVPV